MTSPKKPTIEDLLKEQRNFKPQDAFRKQANINDASIYEKASQDPLAFWETWARELKWDEPWKKTLDWKPPHAKWFLDGKINACVNCVDRHVFTDDPKSSRRNKAALIWEGEPGDTKVLTYWALYREVSRFADVLKRRGIEKGDRVALYMPNIPELVIACLACSCWPSQRAESILTPCPLCQSSVPKARR